MGTRQKIELDGTTYVVLPAADLERLEELADLAEAREISARIDRGEEELYPAELVHAIFDGENPVRAFRKYRGMTLAQLAEHTGLSRPYLSQIEAGRKTGSLETIRALAECLDTDMEMLVPAGDNP